MIRCLSELSRYVLRNISFFRDDETEQSRETIYKRIMKLSESDFWEYDYETFVAYDAVNRSNTSRPAPPDNQRVVGNLLIIIQMTCLLKAV